MTPSSSDGVEHHDTSAADEKKDAGGGAVGGAGQRAPAAGHEVGIVAPNRHDPNVLVSPSS